MSRLYETLLSSPLIATHPPYLIKYAENEEEILQTLKLRYIVFNQEQGHCCENNETGIDQDEYDTHSVHLIVKHIENQSLIGTYRIIEHPNNNIQEFYSAQEFDLTNIPNSILSDTIELGRSCVHPDFRNTSVISLLWAGIATTMLRSSTHYTMGCASLTETSPIHAWAIWDYLKKQNKQSYDFMVKPKQDYILERPSDEEIRKYQQENTDFKRTIPPLIKGYLSTGGEIYGEPAFDRKFGTIDFLMILNLDNLPQRYIKHFFPNGTLPRGENI